MKNIVKTALVIGGLLLGNFSENSRKENYLKNIFMRNTNPDLELKREDFRQTRIEYSALMDTITHQLTYNHQQGADIVKGINLYKTNPELISKYDSLKSRINHFKSDTSLVNYEYELNKTALNDFGAGVGFGLGGILSLTGAISFFRDFRRRKEKLNQEAQ